MKHMTETPTAPTQFRPDLSPALEQVVLKSLAKEPVDRYATGAELTQALQEAIQETPSTVTPSARLSLIDKVALTQNEPLDLSTATPTPPYQPPAFERTPPPFVPPVVDIPPPAYQPPPQTYTPPPAYAVVNEPEPTAYGYTTTPAEPVYEAEPEPAVAANPPAAGMPAWLPLAMGIGFGLIAFAVIAWLFSGGEKPEVIATPTAGLTTTSVEVIADETSAPTGETPTTPAENGAETPLPTEEAVVVPVSGPPYTYFFPIVVKN